MLEQSTYAWLLNLEGKKTKHYCYTVKEVCENLIRDDNGSDPVCTSADMVCDWKIVQATGHRYVSKIDQSLGEVHDHITSNFFPFGNVVYSTSTELFKVMKKIFAPLAEPNI